MSDDYKNILSNFTIPTNWAGFYPQNDVTNKSSIVVRLCWRKALGYSLTDRI